MEFGNLQRSTGQAVTDDNTSPTKKERNMTFDYEIHEELRTVRQLAPVVPPEFLKQACKELPVVREMASIISSWYLYISHMFYAQLLPSFNPGMLDDNLNRMEAVLTEVEYGFTKTTRIH